MFCPHNSVLTNHCLVLHINLSGSTGFLIQFISMEAVSKWLDESAVCAAHSPTSAVLISSVIKTEEQVQDESAIDTSFECEEEKIDTKILPVLLQQKTSSDNDSFPFETVSSKEVYASKKLDLSSCSSNSVLEIYPNNTVKIEKNNDDPVEDNSNLADDSSKKMFQCDKFSKITSDISAPDNKPNVITNRMYKKYLANLPSVKKFANLLTAGKPISCTISNAITSDSKDVANIITNATPAGDSVISETDLVNPVPITTCIEKQPSVISAVATIATTSSSPLTTVSDCVLSKTTFTNTATTSNIGSWILKPPLIHRVEPMQSQVDEDSDEPDSPTYDPYGSWQPVETATDEPSTSATAVVTSAAITTITNSTVFSGFDKAPLVASANLARSNVPVNPVKPSTHISGISQPTKTAWMVDGICFDGKIVSSKVDDDVMKYSAQQHPLQLLRNQVCEQVLHVQMIVRPNFCCFVGNFLLCSKHLILKAILCN